LGCSIPHAAQPTRHPSAIQANIKTKGSAMNSSDKTAIENLLFRYARYVDTAQYDELGKLFANAKVTANKHDGVISGENEVRDYWKMSNKRFEDGTPRTHHVVTNLEFESSGDGGPVKLRSCFTVFQATDKLPLQPIAAGRYQDEFRKTGSQWQFAAKHIEVTMLGEMSHHLNMVLPK
jgi:3-phenylpropionate/cinnamic acid dioxygenase small subunit